MVRNAFTGILRIKYISVLFKSIAALLVSARHRSRLRPPCWIGLFCIAIVLAGCTPQENSQTSTTPSQQSANTTLPNATQPIETGTVLPFTTVAKGEHFSASPRPEKSVLVIITSEQEIDSQLLQVTGVAPQPGSIAQPFEQVRQIDFDRFFTILVLQGKQASGGYEVTVQQITRRGNQVQVQAEFVSPAPGQIVTAEITDPYHLIAVEKSGSWKQEVRFELIDNGKVIVEAMHFIP
jgi:hypothetical protein